MAGVLGELLVKSNTNVSHPFATVVSMSVSTLCAGEPTTSAFNFIDIPDAGEYT